MATQIAIVDYGVGNRRSVEKAFEHVGAAVALTGDPAVISAAAGVVVPGVGAFPAGMGRLNDSGLADVVRQRANAGVPVLGICLGMQLLFDRSTEQDSATPGLGLIAGAVQKLQVGNLKLPHIGWNEVAATRASALTAGLPDPCAFYHVHSYVVHPARPEVVVGRAEYGASFPSIVEHGNIFGVQFHPEKSSRHGLQLLRNFVTLCTQSPVGVSQ